MVILGTSEDVLLLRSLGRNVLFVCLFLGQEVHTFRSPGKHLQCKVHAPHQRSGDRLLLRRRHHLLHPHWEESGVQQTVSVHLPLWNSLRGTELENCLTERTHLCLVVSASRTQPLVCLFFARLWRYQTTPTRFCRVGRTAQCDGLTFAWKRAALKKTAKMYADSRHSFLLHIMSHYELQWGCRSYHWDLSTC